MAPAPVPTSDLDPPALHSTSTSPAAGAKSAGLQPGPGKQQSKLPRSAGADATTGNKSVPMLPKAGSLSPQGRTLSPKGRTQQKPAPAAQTPISPVHDSNGGTGAHRRDKHASLEHVLKGSEPMVKDCQAADAKAAVGKGLKRLKKQLSVAEQDKQQAAQHTQQDFESNEDVPSPAVPAEPKHVEISVMADAMDVDVVEAGCARSRPWTKHLKVQTDTEDGDHDADQAMEPANPTATNEATADPASPIAAPVVPAAVAVSQDTLEQTGSGGAGHAATPPAEQEKLNEPTNHSHRQAHAMPGKQRNEGDHSHTRHQPRTSRTSPANHQLREVATAQEQAQTGDSRPRTGKSQPRGRQPQGPGQLNPLPPALPQQALSPLQSASTKTSIMHSTAELVISFHINHPSCCHAHTFILLQT